ncbi:glycosyltransferase [Aestuariimicrobium sp. p3-SID1156]|uniref:glycosyltransferase n=1 Tax=Aestuariimicrobium sp. p3-SID1156 TaxID=2916038 RepID=UPI00223AAEEE|nr:glycosyltransferase [Aestuariimicrobium sp. p3-SID1156]MCT1459815.1 glycosyltransferase [Aestuariimicrobium sp. p3-SID1156]
MSNHPWDRGFAGRVKALLYSNRGTLLRPLHRALTSTMLFGVGAVDAWRHRGEQPDARLAQEVTIAVKTFERPEAVKRFVRSARRVFDGRIVVADDSREPWRTSEPGVEVVELPFNSGVTRGRNAALERVETPYVIVADDDLVFTHGTDWVRALDYLERNPEVDAVAPILVEVPRWYTIIFDDDQLFAKRKDPLREPGEVIDGLPVRLKTPQVYLARTESIRRIGWDEQIRMLDHKDFFSRASGELVFVQDEAIMVFHARTPWNREYNRHRNDVEADRRYLQRKWR